MREIDGYVFIAECRESEFMFGKPVSKGLKVYESIELNGLSPYESSEQAKKAATAFFKFPFYLVTLGKLWMRLAETREELDYFTNKTNLIVIMKDYDGRFKTDKLFGPLPTKKRRTTAYPIPGAYLLFNGYKPFKKKFGQTAFDRAKYQLKEINRQGQCGATMAQFKLKKLEELFRK